MTERASLLERIIASGAGRSRRPFQMVVKRITRREAWFPTMRNGAEGESPTDLLGGLSKATQPPSVKGRLCESVVRFGQRSNRWIGRLAGYRLHFVIPAIAMWASASEP